MKKATTIFVIFITSFQLAFGQTILRFPAQVQTHDQSIKELDQELLRFKELISGKEDDSECKNENSNEALAAKRSTSTDPNNEEEYFLDLLQKNACSLRGHQLDEKSTHETQESCVVYKEPGLIDRLVDEMLKADKNEEEIPLFRLDDPEVQEVHRKAQNLMQQVRLYLYDNNVSREERVFLLTSYLENVALQMRDLIVTKRSYLAENEYEGTYFYQDLLPEFPKNLIRENEQHFVDLITSGSNPSVSPLNLKIVDKGMGRLGVEYRSLETMSRDIMTLLKAPTNQNYLRALKWMTLQMMLSQQLEYSLIVGDQDRVEVPRSCQDHLNGDLPSSIELPMNSSSERQKHIEGLLIAHGLQIDNDNHQYIEYYIDNVDKNPLESGYSGLYPFEEYRVALQGKESSDWHPSLKPMLDDITHFEKVLQMKLPEAQKVYRGEVKRFVENPSGRRPLRESRNMTYAGADQFDMIISTPNELETYEVEDEYGYTYTLDPIRQNLSSFMADMMQRKGILDYRELISDKLREDLSNNEINLDFPSLYSAHVWREWSLKNLALALDKKKNAGARDSVVSGIQQICYNTPQAGTHKLQELCNLKNGTLVSQLSKKLEDFKKQDDFTPLRRLEEEKYQEVYPLLYHVWSYLRDRTDLLKEAKTNEYDLLISQMEASNPWARARLSYLIAMDEMQRAHQNHIGERVSTRRGMRTASNTKCFYSHIEGRMERLKAAAQKIGLDKEFKLNFSNQIVSGDEKEFIWNDTLDTRNQGSSYLLTQELYGQKTYESLEEISYETLLSRESVEKFKQKNRFSLSAQEEQEIENVLSSEVGKKGELFYQLYKLKGDPEKQQEMYQAHARQAGISSGTLAKRNFLVIDTALKMPFMKRVVKEAARERRQKVQDQMDELCMLEADDHERMKTLFYSTTKAQNKINQMAGLQGVPEELLEQIQSMSPEEWSNMWKGLGAGVLTIGAIVFSGVCAGVTGGACLAFSPMIVGAAMGALGLQADLMRSEYNLKKDSDSYAKQVKFMEELGFSDTGSSNEVSRTWVWTVMEGLFLLPIIGIAGRTAKLGSKMAYVSGQHLLKGSSKEVFKEAAKETIEEADVRTARYILGMDEMVNSKTLEDLASQGARGKATLDDLQDFMARKGLDKKMVKDAFTSIENYRSLFSSGKMSMEQMISGTHRALAPLKKAIQTQSGGFFNRQLGKVSVLESQKMIDKKTAQVVSKYFGHNPAALAKRISMYSGKNLEKAKALIGSSDVKKGVQRVPLLGKAVSSIRKMRYQGLVDNADKVLRLEESLKRLSKEGGDLEAFILNNIEDMTDVFSKIPTKAIEFPYLGIIQGSPSIGGRFAGTRTPGLGAIADGVILRKFFNARARLVYESYKAEAKQILSLPTHVGGRGTYMSFKGFQYSVQEAQEKLTKNEARSLARDYSKLENQIVEKLYTQMTRTNSEQGAFRFKEGAKVHDLGREGLRRVVFEPENLEERALGEVIWSSVSSDELFDLKDMGQVAHRVVQELSDYNSVDQFQVYLNALKVSVIHRNPSKVDVF